MTRSEVIHRLNVYRSAQTRRDSERDKLRQAVLDWKDKGATIVEIADTLGWSRQSVYDLIGKSA